MTVVCVKLAEDDQGSYCLSGNTYIILLLKLKKTYILLNHKIVADLESS